MSLKNVTTSPSVNGIQNGRATWMPSIPFAAAYAARFIASWFETAVQPTCVTTCVPRVSAANASTMRRNSSKSRA